MKIALCLSGMPRNFKECYAGYYENLLKNHDVDVFGFFWDDKTEEDCKRGGEYNYTPGNMDLFIETYKPKKVVTHHYTEEKKQEFLKEHEIFRIKSENQHPMSKTMFPMFYGIEKADQLRRSYNTKYDIVIRGRTDLMNYSKFDFSETNNNTVYMSLYNSTGGINDTFWYSDEEVANKFNDLYTFATTNDFSRLPYKYFPHETILACQMLKNNIKLFGTLDNQVIYRWSKKPDEPDHFCRDNLWITPNGWRGDPRPRCLQDRLF